MYSKLNWCKILFSLLFIAQSFTMWAQQKIANQIEPLNWWVGMQHPELQIMLHGDHISQYEIRIDNPNMQLKTVHKVESPNYLFVDVLIPFDAKPGTVPIDFYLNGKKVGSVGYTLLQKSTDKNRIQGVTSKDFIYLIMPDRFSNGDTQNDVVKTMRENTLNRKEMYARHGGDLKGISNHFDYLKDLGVTAIWNTPEVENDMKEASYHGYAVTDHYRIDPRYGTNESYKAYVEEAHQKGLKVIKDIVHNHIGLYHWMMNDLPMKDWLHQWNTFTQTNYRDQTVMDPYAATADKARMLDGWFVTVMPDLNQKNPFVQNYLNQNHIWWIEYAGIDGLRLDTYPYNDPEYMANWAKLMLDEFPNLSIFGECLVWSVPNQAFFAGGNTVNRGFDTHLPGVTDAVVKDAIAEALNGKEGWTDGLNRLYAVMAQDFLYQHPEKNVVFLDNHDMSRFYSVIGEDMNKYKAGIVLLLTLRGVPQMYYGTEILMKNFSNPDGLVREDFPGGWKEDKVNKFTKAGRTEKENEAFDFVRTLARYRAQNSALQTGKMMQFIPDNQIYVYFRYDDAHTVMVIVSKNDKPVELATQRFVERIQQHQKALNIHTQETVDISKSIQVPAHGTLVLELK